MRLVTFTLIFLTFIVFIAFAGDCKIIEYPDRNEVICEGTADTSTKMYNKTDDRVRDLENKIERLKWESDLISKRTGRETPDELSQKLIESFRKTKEMVLYRIEHAELTMKDRNKFEAYKKQLYEDLDSYERSNSFAIASLSTESIKPKVKISSISALETGRGYSYVYYSVKADVDNMDTSPHKVSFTIQAKDYNGHILDSVRFLTDLEKRQSKTVAEELMLKIDNIPAVRTWDAGQITIY